MAVCPPGLRRPLPRRPACACLVAACAALAGLDPDAPGFEDAVRRAVCAAVGVWGIVQAVYFWLFTELYGQTPGKLLFGFAVVGPDGRCPGLVRVLVRELAGTRVVRAGSRNA